VSLDGKQIDTPPARNNPRALYRAVVPELCNETIEEEQEEEEFSMKMNTGQRQQYKTQFSQDSAVTGESAPLVTARGC
jgi:hypothetical protein